MSRSYRHIQQYEKEILELKSQGLTPSMSRRGNPYDNAMAENFFSILKTELQFIPLTKY